VTLLSALPYLGSLVALQVNGWHSDRSGERRLHGAVPLLLAGLSAVPLIFLSPGTGVVLGLVVMVISFQNAYLPPFWAMPSAVLGETAAASAIGFAPAEIDTPRALVTPLRGNRFPEEPISAWLLRLGGTGHRQTRRMERLSEPILL